MSTQTSNEQIETILKEISNELKTLNHREEDITNSINDVKSRLGWGIHSPCKIYSRSKEEWFDGIINTITTNSKNEEWLIIKYNNFKKEMQRFNTQVIKPIKLPQNYTQKPDIIKLIAHKLKQFNTNESTSTIKLDYNFKDLSVFESKEFETETISPGDSCQIEHCKKVQRLLCCLHFYTQLKNNQNDRDKFDKFTHETYTEMLNDYLHFTENHTHDLQNLHSVLTNNNSFDKCDNNCRFTTTEKKSNEPAPNFYEQHMDQLHTHIFHTYGSITYINSLKRIMSFDEEDESVNFVDTEFAKMQEEQKANKSVNFVNKDKFTIQVMDKDVGKDRTTYIDGMVKHLRSKKLIEPDSVKKFEQIISDQEHDTDTVLYDMQVNSQNIPGNIEIEMKDNKHTVAELKIYIRVAKSSKSSFSVGIRFYYWPFFKERLQYPKEEQRAFNQNDHGGYSIAELFVERKYKDFGEEISNYEHINWNDYQTEVVTKANKYLSSEKVKSIKSAVVREAFERLHYDIPEGRIITYENLVSLLLYTDWSALCTDFSSTFRKVSRTEKLDSVKKRNREYYWLSKTLRETVECFGQRGCGDWNGEGGKNGKWNPKNMINKLRGPFYTGMNWVMIMPEFNLRLSSPTSTSAAIQIAINFSGVTGIIIQLNNDKKPGDLVRGFDCSWISRYPQEEERLFFGGFFRIKIEGIRLRQTNENFFDFFQPLFYLDALLTGTRDTDQLPLKKKGKTIIKKLLKWRRTQKECGLHKYILDTFLSFCNNKRQISLDLYPLSKAKEDMVKLIMYGVEKDTGNKKEDDKINLFRTDIFDVFENVTQMEINTFCLDPKTKKGQSGFSLSLLCLLSIIQSTPLENVTVKVPIVKNEKDDHWLNKVWSEKQGLIEEKYEEKGYKVEVKNVKKKFADEDWFIVKKK